MIVGLLWADVVSYRFDLARVEERLSRLVITRETVDQVLNAGAGARAAPAAMLDGMVPSRSGCLSPVEVLAVPAWLRTGWRSRRSRYWPETAPG